MAVEKVIMWKTYSKYSSAGDLYNFNSAGDMDFDMFAASRKGT